MIRQFLKPKQFTSFIKRAIPTFYFIQKKQTTQIRFYNYETKNEVPKIVELSDNEENLTMDEKSYVDWEKNNITTQEIFEIESSLKFLERVPDFLKKIPTDLRNITEELKMEMAEHEHHYKKIREFNKLITVASLDKNGDALPAMIPSPINPEGKPHQYALIAFTSLNAAREYHKNTQRPHDNIFLAPQQSFSLLFEFMKEINGSAHDDEYIGTNINAIIINPFAEKSYLNNFVIPYEMLGYVLEEVC